MLFEFVSMALVWLFELVSIAKISKNETKMVNMKSRCQNPKGFAPDDLTRPGQRPGEFPCFLMAQYLNSPMLEQASNTIVNEIGSSMA